MDVGRAIRANAEHWIIQSILDCPRGDWSHRRILRHYTGLPGGFGLWLTRANRTARRRIHALIKAAGFKWQKAKIVLTSKRSRERYEYIPASLTVVREVCLKYACACTVRTAGKPPQPIEKEYRRSQPAGAGNCEQVRRACAAEPECADLLNPLYGWAKAVGSIRARTFRA